MVTSRLMAGLLALAAVGCGPLGSDVHDDFNSRDTGPYLTLGRMQQPDGTLVVHLAAHRPENAEEIARQVVRQNYALSAVPLRVVVDGTRDGRRQVFRWDGRALQSDSSAEGLPPPSAGSIAHDAPPAPH